MYSETSACAAWAAAAGVDAPRVTKVEPPNWWAGHSLDPVRVPLNPLWPEPNQVYAVAVSAVTDGKITLLPLEKDKEPV